MRQERLFVLAPEAINLHVTFVPAQGWSAVVVMRRQDEQWPDAYRSDYSYLSTEELFDTLAAELARILFETL